MRVLLVALTTANLATGIVLFWRFAVAVPDRSN